MSWFSVVWNPLRVDAQPSLEMGIKFPNAIYESPLYRARLLFIGGE
jgi:hypothetical protein